MAPEGSGPPLPWHHRLMARAAGSEGRKAMTPSTRIETGQVMRAAPAIAIAVAVFLASAAPAQAAPWWMRWGRGPHGYDPNTVVTIEATVRAVKPTPPMPSLECERELGEAVTVVLGPLWYLEQAGITFATGDRVIVEGSKVMEDSGRIVVVAARVEKLQEKVTLRLRDERGTPLWGHMGMGGGGRGPMR